MPLDHGVLNVPLNKRGNFHKELDEHLEAERRRQKQEHQDAKVLHAEAKLEARRLFTLIDNELLKHHAEKRNISPAELIDVVRSMCNDRPQAAVKVIRELLIAR